MDRKFDLRGKAFITDIGKLNHRLEKCPESWIPSRMARKLKRLLFGRRVTSVTSVQRCYFAGRKLLISLRDDISERDSFAPHAPDICQSYLPGGGSTARSLLPGEIRSLLGSL